MDAALDVFFLVVHTALVAFVLAGWAWRRTRRLHLAAVSLVLASWVGLGAVYGWGYCPLTDWHWDVKRRLGETDLPASYVTYHLDWLTGTAWNPAVVDALVVVLGVGAFALSVGLNWRDRQRVQRDRRARARVR